MPVEHDAVIVGSGPNGLAAAITLARAGCSVLVCEANATIGGGARSAELTLPGFLHDVCSAVHPLAAGSPFFKTLPLEQFGLEWIQPDIPLAHPLDGGTAACLHRDVDLTAESLGGDSRAYRRLFQPFGRLGQTRGGVSSADAPLAATSGRPREVWSAGDLPGDIAREGALRRR